MLNYRRGISFYTLSRGIQQERGFPGGTVYVCVSCSVWPTLCDSMDYSPLGSSVHVNLQTRILEWVAMPFSRGPGPRDQPQVSHMEMAILYHFNYPGKNLSANVGNVKDVGLIPGLGRPPGGRPPGRRYGNPLQPSCLENLVDRGAWQTTIHRVTKSQTQLKWLSTHTQVMGYIYFTDYSIPIVQHTIHSLFPSLLNLT